jgi:hypothetical protein
MKNLPYFLKKSDENTAKCPECALIGCRIFSVICVPDALFPARISVQ